MTVRRLFGFLRPYRGQVIVSTLLAIGSQVAVLTIPYLTGRAIDATRPGHRDRSALMLDAGLIVAAGALQGVLMFCAGSWRGGSRCRSSTTCETRCTATCSGSRSGSTTATRPGS